MGLRILHRSERPTVDLDSRLDGLLDGPLDRPLEVPVLPQADDPLTGQNLLTSLLPVMGGVGMMMFVIVRPDPLYLAIGVVWLLAMVGAGGAMAWRGRTTRRLQRERTRRDYAAKLDTVAREVQGRVAVAAAAVASANPPAEALVGLCADGRRLWERGSDHHDLLTVRLGSGRQDVAVADVLTEEPKPGDEDSDAVCRDLRDRMLDTPVAVHHMPLTVDLADLRTARVCGGDRARSMTRAVVAQLAVWHSPQDLRLLVCSSPERAAAWAWVAWLPHTRWTEIRGAEADRPVVVGTARSEEALRRLMTERRGPTSDGRPTSEPHLLVVLDGVAQELWDAGALAMVRRQDRQHGHQHGARLSVVGIDAPARPDVVEPAIEVRADGRTVARTGEEEGSPFRADALGPATCEALARAIAGWRLAGTDLGSAAAANDAPHLPALLGAERTADLTPERFWAPRSDARRLTVPIGTTVGGEPLVLDLKEPAAGGMGPHGLIVGATGSGKSELLRTLALGLAATHPPEELAFVLVDYKGGAAFSGLEALPHVAGLVTNLSDDDSLVERARVALLSEMRRRQAAFAEHGVGSLHDYRRLRAQDPSLEPEPTLLIVIDEFAELLKDHRDVGDLLNSIGRLGRSLGVHLLLASQRLEGTGMSTLESHISYRIALRTFTAADSQAVLGTRAAHELPTQPGLGLMATAGSTVRFRAAYVGAPAATSVRADAHPVRPLLAATCDQETAEKHVDDETVAEPGSGARTVLDEVVHRYRDAAERVRPVWVPPLPASVTLAQLLPELERDAERGLCVRTDVTGSRRLRVGLLDRPERQRVEPVALDLRGAESTLAIVGSAQMGKSTTLATLILSAALTHTPDELSFYVVDLGGGGLEVLEGLPHVGAVSGRGAPDRLRRTLLDMRTLLERREALGGSARERETERDVVLVVDGFAELRALDEDYEPLVGEIARRGPGVGVHVWVTASRWTDIRPVVRDYVSGRLELRLTEPSDTVFDRRRAELVTRTPGRALAGGGALVQVCAPTRAGEPTLAELVDAVREMSPGPSAEPPKMLPDVVGSHELTSVPAPALALGLAEHDLATVGLDLAGSGPHLLAFGDSGSGRTSILRHVVHQLARQPEEPLIYLFDPRLGLMEACPDDRLAGYAASAVAAEKSIAEIANLMSGREPDADVDRRALAARSWWSGPHVYVVADDVELFAGAGEFGESPFAPLATYVRRGHDLGLHVVAAGRVKEFHRMLREPLVAEAMANGCPSLLLSGDRSEGVLYDGHRAEKRPPGRALFTRPTADPLVVQTPLVPPDPPLEGQPDEARTSPEQARCDR